MHVTEQQQQLYDANFTRRKLCSPFNHFTSKTVDYYCCYTCLFFFSLTSHARRSANKLPTNCSGRHQQRHAQKRLFDLISLNCF